MSKQRHIPDKFLPAVEQGLLNLALNGFRVLRDDGTELTASLLGQAGRINQQFDEALPRSTGEVAMAAPKPSGMPAKKVEPKTPRVRRAAKRDAGPPKGLTQRLGKAVQG
jgi:hypothetical protein